MKKVYHKKQHKLYRSLLAVAAIGILLVVYYWCAYQNKEGICFVKQLGAGINLGNSLDVYKLRKRKPDASIEDFETYWGNPPATEQLMEAIHSGGFSTVRIPVSWGEHMDKEGNVDPDWMARVTQLVDYALKQGLYVILNTHHEPWLIPSSGDEEKVTRLLTNLWTQIALNFSDRDEHLLFESMNEPRMVGTKEEWTSGTSEARHIINRLNAAFVKAVREAGGNNAQRWLLLPAYATTSKETALASLELPKDKKLIVTVHAYLPHRFAQDENGTKQWSSSETEDTKEIDQMMERLERLFISRNIPVVITEYGCCNKENMQERLSWADYYTSAAKEKGIPLVWWDNGKSYQLIDRHSCIWTQPELAELLVNQAVTE